MRTALLSFFFVPLLASARTYDATNLPYKDPPRDRETAVAVSTLTSEGILQGNPDGTFRPDTPLNRAEYVKIVMAAFPIGDMAFALGCFPDVPEDVWYSVPVCKARALGIVRGNQKPGLAFNQWPFEPERSVQYEEAVKVLVSRLGLTLDDQQDDEWYEPYLRAAEKAEIDLPGVEPGHVLTRGEMSRLVVAFIAERDGELEDLRAAQSGERPATSSVRSSSTSSSSSRSSARSSVQTLSSAAASYSYDPDNDADTRQRILVLGTTSHVMAGFDVFSESEPLDVRVIKVILTSEVTSIDSFKIYDQEGRFIGTAHRDTSDSSGKTYRLSMSNGTLVLEKEKSRSFYVRPVLRHFDLGGTSGQDAQVDDITIEGDGVWSNRDYIKTSSETFSAFETARSTITQIKNAGQSSSALVVGPGQFIGEFSFTGMTGDAQADLEVTSLTFTVSKSSALTLSNAVLMSKESSETTSCTVGASTITCSGIPAGIGTFDGFTTTLRVRADLSTTGSEQWLQLSLNNTGSPSSAGDISWTDGTTTFTWVPQEPPVASGTYYRQ